MFSREYASRELTMATPVSPAVQRVLSTPLPPTRSLCVDMHPPLDYGQDSPLPIKQGAVARWMVPTCLTVFVYTLNTTYQPFQGLVVQVRANNTPVGRFQTMAYCKLVGCPPGRENTIVGWFDEPHYIFAVDWRSPPGYDKRWDLNVHVTVIRDRGVYWRIVINPTPFKKFPNHVFKDEPDLTYELYTTKIPFAGRWLDDIE